MAIYYCPLCNKKFFIDNINDVDETITCSMCGSSINVKQLAEEYEQKQQNGTLDEEEITFCSNENTADITLKIQKRQLEELESIKNMLKFFTILTVISLIISFISAMFIIY